MAKTAWKPGTMLYPLPPVMVTCGTTEQPNVFTAAWTGIVNSEPAMTYISVRPSRYSHELITKNKEFVINLTTRDTLKAADFCGVKSGRDTDKFKEAGLTPEPCQFVKAPMIAQSPLSLECRVVDVKSLGSHDMFLAEILAVNVDDSLLDDNGALRLENSGLVAFCHGAYYGLGEKLGTFGFSVAKKKSRKQRITEIKHERAEHKKQVKALHRKEEEEAEDEKPAFEKRKKFAAKPHFDDKPRFEKRFDDKRRDDKKFGEKKFGDKKFGDKKRPFKADKPRSDKPAFDKPKFDKPKFDKPKFDRKKSDKPAFTKKKAPAKFRK